MIVLVVLFLICVLLPIASGMAICRRAGTSGRPARSVPERSRLRAPVLAVPVWLVGSAAVLGVSIGLGFLAKSLESSVDRPVYGWVHGRVHYAGSDGHSLFTKLNEKLTLIGNNPTVELVVLISGIVLAFVYRRRWWIPVVALLGAFYTEKFVQKWSGKIVDRGYPPLDFEHQPTHGTYFSGGVGRILVVYGVVVLLTILAVPTLSRAWRVGLWTGLVTAATVEGFTRIYLSKHWLTDVVGGLVIGSLLLLVCVAAVRLLARARAAQPAPTPETQFGRHAAEAVTMPS